MWYVLSYIYPADILFIFHSINIRLVQIYIMLQQKFLNYFYAKLFTLL